MSAIKRPVPHASSHTAAPAGAATHSDAGGLVRNMHDMIERRMAADTVIAVDGSPFDGVVETISRLAAYPALVIAAVGIGSLIRAAIS